MKSGRAPFWSAASWTGCSRSTRDPCMNRRRGHGGTAVLVAASVVTIAAGAAEDLSTFLARVGRSVEAYYSHARSIICTERVVLQPLDRDFTPTAISRRLEYELRIEW